MFSITNGFKKIVILAICLSMLAANFNVYAVENTEAREIVNLIDDNNASCEILDDFLTYDNPEPTKGNVGREISNEYFHSGDGSLKITIPGSYRTLVGFKPSENLVEGKNYRFSVWYYNPDNTQGTLYLRYAIPHSISGWLTGEMHDFPCVMQNGGWYKYEVNFTATNALATNLSYLYITSTSTSGTIYFDDISLMQKEPPTEYTNLFDSYDANCENLVNFNTHEYKEPDKGEVGREIDNSFYYNGNSSLKITIPGSYRTLAGIAPTEKLVAGNEYTISVWYYKEDAANQAIYFRYATSNGHGNWITGTAHDTQTTMQSGVWTKYSFTFTATTALAEKLKYFYITTTSTSGEMYLDDFVLRMVPETETELITNNLGSFDSISEFTLEFDNDIDLETLPETVKIDGVSVNATYEPSDDSKTVNLVIEEYAEPGSHILSLECKDLWNRAINAAVSFSIAGEATDIYDNMINQPTADCEDISEFSTNAFAAEPVEISIDTETIHSGTGSVKTYTEKEYRPLIMVKPNDKLVAGQKYSFSAWYYTESINGTKKMFLRYSKQNNTNISNWVTGTAFDSGANMVAGEWTKYEYTFTATEALASETFSNLYLTSENKNCTIYFDDISLRKVPGSETALLTTDLGSFEKAETFTLEFDKKLDKYSLPESVMIDSSEMNADSALSDDGKVLTITLKGTVAPGNHTLRFDTADLWNRNVSASAAFKVEGEVSGDTPADDSNLLSKGTASCEDISEFKANAITWEPVTISIATDKYHSGSGSLKTATTKNYRPLVAFKPNAPLIKGKTYNFSVWYYTDETITGTKNMYLRYSKQNNTNIGGWITGVTYDSGAPMVSGKWTKYAFSFTATEALTNETFTCFYLTSEIGAASKPDDEETAQKYIIYFDDMSLAKVPDGETTLVESDFGKYDTVKELTLEFTDVIDESSLPTSVMIDGTAVGVTSSLSSDGKKLTLVFRGTISAGKHTMVVSCKDKWNRPVSVSASFETESESGTPAGKYGNLINEWTADCEDLSEFSANATSEPVEISISEDMYHSGTSSLKTSTTKKYRPLAVFKPNAPLIAGEKYYFSAWYYTDETVKTEKMYLRFTSNNNTNISNWVTGEAKDSGAAVVSGKWTKYSFSFTATEALAAETFTNFYLTTEIGSETNPENESTAKKYTVYFDDINLRLVNPENITLVGYLPENNAQKVKLSSGLRLEFTGEADSSDVGVDIYENGELNEGGILCYNEGNTLVIKPKSGMIPDIEYKFVIKYINDAYGRAIIGNSEGGDPAMTVSFKTAQRLGFDISYYTEDNVKLSKPRAGSAKAKIRIENNNGFSFKSECVAVVMVCEGQRVKKVYATDTIKLKKDEILSDIELMIDDIPNNNCYLKAFLWTDTSASLRTLAECIEFR